MLCRSIPRMASASCDFIGTTGRRYRFEELLQERPHVGRVWLARSGRDKFLLKDIPKDIYTNFIERIKPQLPESRYIRLPCDTIPGHRILVYKYLTDNFLHLKKILKNCLLGIAELHERHIVHLDIKPDNVLVGCRQDEQGLIIEDIQIIDFENAAYIPKGRCIKGMLAGNDNWRSPEAHFKGELNKPTDIFSFGIVCIYAVLGHVILGPDDDFRTHEMQGVFPAIIRLQRQVSYFGDHDGVNGLLRHLQDDESSCQVLKMLWDGRTDEDIPYKSFSEWPEVVDPAFEDLIRGLTNLNPTKRLTARQALEHPWFMGL
ncbi:putative calcium/calmodulin dependent protein kinase [Aspergillus novofumigatus IBT 16806]|uniref:Putative calcium/calmodulin dependent protein kinase n=1 Tax=Aspergillus novofumigatus (strain IBT 16806) TaxID=1392255 RepID=A0A2I1C7A5_ASPN1|nr:putative calcium/calmodulin dependent protein kinase [Aspergillus novofumigatus IBT 16806]PKX93466.1 putative calcium/calmodulin dependent protein kinase [Aspergillus novofumigatus IBT 16806]